MLSQQEILNSIIYTFIVFVLMALVLILFFYFSRKKILQQEIEKRNMEVAYQKELLRSVILTQETERKRIAQDLHDDISSKLNVVSLNAHLLKTPNLTSSEYDDIIGSISSLTDKALENSRKLAHGLLPPVLVQFGLNAGIEELVLEFNNSKKVYIQYTNECEFKNDDLNYSLNIYRILQELINNSIRHGKATEIKINMINSNGYYKCNYVDNGKGFDSTLQKNKGLGLNNIKSRIDFVNGKFNIESQVNNGVKAEFIF